MNITFFVFYSVALLFILGGGVLVYLLIRRRNPMLGVLAGLSSSVLLVVIWPIPIHGGFTFLGEIMLHELSDQWQRVEEKVEESKDNRFLRGLEARFAGVIQYGGVITLAGDWSTLTLPGGELAWLDHHSGLIWSKPRILITANPLGALEKGKSICREYKPIGYWALPTEAERYMFWRAEGREYLPDNVAPAMGVIIDESLGIMLPSVSLPASGSGNNKNNKPPGVSQLTLRCVALGPAAPSRGYIRSDIDLSEWNRYQLSKLAGD